MSLENPIPHATPLLVQVWATGWHGSAAWKPGRNVAPCRPCPRLNKAEGALKSLPSPFPVPWSISGSLYSFKDQEIEAQGEDGTRPVTEAGANRTLVLQSGPGPA